ncbi:hypothetical protein A8F94_13735 [Bacillus sp. FJAT-27225]|uniref:excalibur calcium-binding domain-containing protein n=1 Tax=Bacillus sp. FJAT-27225 TaxID=1743144 RepID=UPI00080C2E7E|nr:excalibur calcium-binding domain-containing protein [Bacillus sp. FJAT-27225]OCA85907.1 hypothetical protein A8F94_13735 [Bacillus sp. FJAT-27225]
MKKFIVSILSFAFLMAGYANAAFADEDKDCGDFSSNQEVMNFWHSNGYSATNDPHDLDRDNDGLPCEVSKSEYDDFVATQTSSNNDNSNDTSGSTDSAAEGEALPETASNSVTMIGLGAVLALVGYLLVFRKKQTS